MGLLSGKAALVTGSTSGIGLAIAKALAAEGANLTLNGFGEEAEVEATRQSIVDACGVEVRYDGADMAKPAEIVRMIGAAADAFGSLDVLVNNAGIQHTAPVHEFPDETWDAIVAINLSAVFHGAKHALPHMQRQGWGRIINTASVHGLVASVNKAGYIAAKHGVIGLTKVIALENAGSGITCNAISPGWVRTPLIEKQIEAIAERDGTDIETAAERLLGEKQPSAQFVNPEQLGQAAVFLCSPAATQMTGTSLTIDGGWTAQ
jgi:3-hydroxybutyrate dehydrogenase